MSDVVPHTGNGLAPGGAMRFLLDLEQAGKVSPVALDLDDAEPSFEQWTQIVWLCSELRRRSSWYIADAMVYGEQRFGERYAQAADVTGLAEHTLANYCRVASRIPPVRRVEGKNLHWHEPVASLGPAEQRKWLRRALDEGWNRDRLRDALRASDALPRAGKVALGEAAANATERITAAATRVVGAAVETRRGARPGWWVPADVWAALMDAL